MHSISAGQGITNRSGLPAHWGRTMTGSDFEEDEMRKMADAS